MIITKYTAPTMMRTYGCYLKLKRTQWSQYLGHFMKEMNIFGQEIANIQNYSIPQDIFNTGEGESHCVSISCHSSQQ